MTLLFKIILDKLLKLVYTIFKLGGFMINRRDIERLSKEELVDMLFNFKLSTLWDINPMEAAKTELDLLGINDPTRNELRIYINSKFRPGIKTTQEYREIFVSRLNRKAA